MSKRALRIKLEQFRQASQIHGGVLRFCIAVLAVRLSRVKIPSRRLRALIYHQMFGKKYRALNEAEFENPIWSYPSLNALFSRGVRPELRPIAQATNQFLCPCDGRVQEVGRLSRDRLVTIKGVEYSIDSLLPAIDTGPFHDGQFAIFFLAPDDCHRIFSPQDGKIEEVIHVPGYRLLVHPPFQRKEYPVFSLNERIILRLTTPRGNCLLVLVAGWGVGNITLPFDRRFRRCRKKVTRNSYAAPVTVTRGQWIATFELGSTAILILEKAESVSTHLTTEERVKYGQPAFSVGR
jgi:phosphatidylserine decarboxylase